jgi:hypothetical protein
MSPRVSAPARLHKEPLGGVHRLAPGRCAMTDDKLFAEVLDRANRLNPYPIYARLRETPISRQRDGS